MDNRHFPQKFRVNFTIRDTLVPCICKQITFGLVFWSLDKNAHIENVFIFFLSLGLKSQFKHLGP